MKDRYTITEKDPKNSNLFNDILNSDLPFIKTRFKIENGIDKTQFLVDLHGELVWEYEENEEFTLDIKETGNEYVLMLGKKIYDE